jgi:hypothetical protein
MRPVLLAAVAAAVSALAPATTIAQPILQAYTTQTTAPTGQSVFEANHHPFPTAAGQVAEERVIASAPVDDLLQYEVIQLALDSEYTVHHDEFGFWNNKRWTANVRHRVVLGTSPSDTGGIEIGAPLRDSVTPEQHHASLHRIVTHSVETARPGRTWVNLVGRLEAEQGPNGNTGFAGFTLNGRSWANTWPFGTIEPKYTTASVQRWSDRTGSTSGTFVGLGRSTTLKAATLPLSGSLHAVRTTELDLEPGDVVMLSAETNVESQVSRSSGVQVNDEIRVERPGTADGETAGPRLGGLTFDVLPPADATGASHQRYHGVANSAFYVVPATAAAGTYRFHHVLRGAAASDPGGVIYVGYGEISAIALRDTPVSWRPRRSPVAGAGAQVVDARNYSSAEQQRLTTSSDEVQWPATSDRSAVASIAINGTPHFCKQQAVSDYGPSTRADTRGTPRLRLGSNATTVRPAVNYNSFRGVHPFAVSGAGTVTIRLDNPYSNSGSPPENGNAACSRGFTPVELAMRTAPRPAAAAIAGGATAPTLHASTTTAVRDLSQSSSAPSTIHTVSVPNVRAGDRLLVSYRGVSTVGVTNNTGPVALTVVASGSLPTPQTSQVLRSTAENATAAGLHLGLRRHGLWEVPSSFGTVPQTVQIAVQGYALTNPPAQIARTSGDLPYSALNVLAIRNE